MLSREQAITRLNEYGVPFSEDAWQSEAVRKEGEFGIFAIIIRVIAGLFILGMVIVSIAGFVAILGLDDNWEHVVGAIGVLATMFAAWKFRHTYKALEKQYSFRGLLYLSLLLVGKACLLLALIGLLEPWKSESMRWWIVAGVFVAITVSSTFYYRMYLEAFLAVLASLILIDVAMTWQVFDLFGAVRWLDQTSPAAVFAARLAHLAMVFGIVFGLAPLIKIQHSRFMSSVYIYAFGLILAMKLLPAKWVFFARLAEIDAIALVFSSLSLFSVLSLYDSLIGGWQNLKSLEHVIVICCIVILAVLGMHGVLFAIALMALGHMRHDKVLWVIGLIYLPVYLFLFYFSLDVTLLAKSYMLLGSGIFILAARFVLTRFFNSKGLEVENA